MVSSLSAGKRLATILILATFLLFGGFLFFSPVSDVLTVDDQIIYDLMWLDAWSVAFLLVQAIVWLSGLSGRQKAWLGIASLGLYGAVEIGLIFHGTPFSLNAYWGDQKFRQAMLTKFLYWTWPGDFYYQNLPSFYPPMYYLFLAWLGKFFSWKSWELMKIGSLLVYLGWPFVLFVIWRRLVDSLQAWLIVFFTMLVCSHSLPYVLAAPHAFLANTIFIPWWLIYIERIPSGPLSIRSIVAGGLIGALIFSTYFYPFFIAAFLLFLRLTVLRGWPFFSRPIRFEWRAALKVLGAAALLSAPYWAPVLLSILDLGSDRSRGGWHHIDSPGLNMPFLSVTLPGLLFLAGIWYLLRRNHSPVARGLLTLFGSILLFWMVGSVLGARNMSVNLVKARDWLIVFGGPMIGLMVAGLIRRGTLAGHKYVAPALLVLISITFVNTFSQSVRHSMVRTARTAQVPDWGLDATVAAERAGSVYLSGVEELFSFYPVYSFIAANEHYSHPASRFKERSDFLALLHDLQNPGLFAIALRHNRYDPVEYFMPLLRQNELQLIVSISNYPNGHHTYVFGYPLSFVSDSSIFEPVQGKHTYRLHDPPVSGNAQPASRLPVDPAKLAILASYLTDTGRSMVSSYAGVDLQSWRELLEPSETRLVGDALDLVGCVVKLGSDSLQLSIAYRPFRRFPDSCRVYVHVESDGKFQNYDFDPPAQIAQWPVDSLIVLNRTMPDPGKSIRIFTGLFTKDGPLDGGLVAELTR